MRKEYDFSRLKAKKNPYSSKLTKQITIQVDEEIIEYFKCVSAESGVPYQSLINLYLRDCAGSKRKLTIKVK